MKLILIFKVAFIRLYRYVFDKCLVCGKWTGKYRYCSVECACCDGAFSVIRRYKDSLPSYVLKGTLMQPKPHHEADQD